MSISGLNPFQNKKLQDFNLNKTASHSNAGSNNSISKNTPPQLQTTTGSDSIFGQNSMNKTNATNSIQPPMDAQHMNNDKKIKPKALDFQA